MSLQDIQCGCDCHDVLGRPQTDHCGKCIAAHSAMDRVKSALPYPGMETEVVTVNPVADAKRRHPSSGIQPVIDEIRFVSVSLRYCLDHNGVMEPHEVNCSEAKVRDRRHPCVDHRPLYLMESQ